MRLIPLIIILIFTAPSLSAQEKYWIYFQGEKELGAPINPSHTGILKSLDIKIANQSLWLNAVSCYLDDNALARIDQLPFIIDIEPVRSIDYKYKETTSTELNFSHALKQINANAFLNAGLSGKGVKIGILDGGFSGALDNQSLKDIFKEGRIVKSRDYIAEKDLLKSSDVSSKDWHGTTVWQQIAGSETKRLSGLATNALFYLARTEHGDKEFRGEEDNWIAALEWMHKEGVRLINSSLGYSNGFNNPRENYKPEQMDGKTTAISRAAQIAVEKQNMILVVSAGNDGDNSEWKVMTAPADAKSVISVGASEMNNWVKAGYSAIGADFVNFLKPDLVCYSGSGTSFSAPIITGIIACMLEKDSSLSSRKVQEILQSSGHLYPYGNNYLGYGVPNCAKIIDLLNDREPLNNATLVRSKNNYFIIEHPTSDGNLILFHKKDKYTLVHEKIMKTKKERIIIHRPKNIQYTTVHNGDEVIEIHWK